jgi:hypothetical protein
MQSILRREEENVDYIQLEAAHASVVSAHMPVTNCFPMNILSAGSYGGRATRLPAEVTTEEAHLALELDRSPFGREGMLTAKAWSNAVGMAFPGNPAQRTLTRATPAPRAARVPPPNKLPNIDPRLSISSSKVRSAWSMLLAVQLDLSACFAPCPVPRPTLASAPPSVSDSAA